MNKALTSMAQTTDLNSTSFWLARRAMVWLTLGLFVGLAGCGGDGLNRVPITGTVTNQGSPLAGASIQFFPAAGTPGEGAIGTADNEGKFEVISSRRDDPGVPPGKYTVRISRLIDRDGTILPIDAIQADFPNAMESIPAPYSTSNSPLEVLIPESGGEVTVDVPGKLLGKPKK
jgi:hypothetical protein